MSGPNTMPDSARTPGVFYGYIVVAAGFFSMLLVFSVHYAFGIFFKPMSADFGWTRAMTSGAFSLVWVTQGLLAIVMGGLNDRFGPRTVLTVCGVLIGGGYLLMSRTGALWELYLFYGIVVGAGLGGTFVPLTSTTARWFVARRGTMTGLVTSGIGVGALVGPIAANWLIGAYDWRVSYEILGSIVLIGVLVSSQFLRRDPAQMGVKAFGEEMRVEGDPKSGAVGLSIKEACSTRQFWVAYVMFFCYGYTLTAILLHLAPHATDLGISARNAARILAVLGAGSILGKVLLGIAADKIGNKNVYILSFVLMLASLIWLVPVTQPWALYLFALVFGIAYGGLATAHSPLVAWLFGMKQHGLIFGILFNGWTIGCALGPIIAGYIFDVSHSYQVAFIICAAMSLIGLVLAMFLTPADALGEPGGSGHLLRGSARPAQPAGVASFEA